MSNRLQFPVFKVLLVDDELPFLRSLSITLERHGNMNNLILCQDSRQVMDILDSGDVGLVLLDLNMPHISGKELLEKIHCNYPQIGVIVISGINQIEQAVECMQLGAVDYFIKTTEEDRLVRGVLKAVRFIEVQHENEEIRKRLLNDNLDNPEVFKNIITNDKSMRAIFQYLESVANSSQPILITGESGVGKELIAQASHEVSGAQGPLIPINVAGLDDTVFSDTLFGHAPGAFTSAHEVRGGMIEKAENGTLFLDEIGDLSISSQIKLLRLLQSGEYFPLGSDRPKKLKARVVVATHQSLDDKYQSGSFRKDLYYRLYTHHVEIPPLRQRKDDIPLLLNYFLEQGALALGKKIPSYPKELITLLVNYDFPGNIRQLQSMVFDALSTHKDNMLSLDSFRKKIGQVAKTSSYSGSIDTDPTKRRIFVASEPLPHIREITELLVAEAMQRADGNQSIACGLLGISQPALSKRLKKMGS